MVWSLSRSCGITLVCTALALQLGCSEVSLVQWLREWCSEASAKRGANRRDLEIRTCFAPRLVLGIESLASGSTASGPGLGHHHLEEALYSPDDEYPLSWLCHSRGVESGGTEEKGSWRPHWIGLFTQVQDSVPPDWIVLVLTDRGLYARWLYEHIRSLGWHLFMRINPQGHFRPVGASAFRSLATAAPQPSSAWCGRVDCFSQESCRLPCTLLAQWEASYEGAWLVVTDLEPAQTLVAWYG